MTGAALAAVALGSAAQVALYLHHFGVSHRTDGFIAGFAVYSLIVVVAQILRTTAVPLLSGGRPRLDPGAFAWAMVALAFCVVLVGVLLAGVLARAVAGSTGPAGREVAAASLRVMAPAAALQLLGVGLAVRGAVRGRLVSVAVAYMVSAAAGLGAFFALEAAASQRVLAWTTLVASAVLLVAMLIGVGAPAWRRPHLGSVPGAAFGVLRSVPVPAAFVAMYPIALALAPRAHAGQITLFGLAFTACSYLTGFTGQGLSMVDVVELSRIELENVRRRSVLAARAFRYSMLAAVPGLAVAALAGAPIVHALASKATSSAHASFGTEVLLLVPWTVGTLGVWATLPVVLADLTASAERRLGLGVLGLIAIHVGAVLAGGAIGGFNSVVAAMAIAPLAFAGAMLRIVVRPATYDFARTTMAVIGAAAISYGLVDLGSRAVLGAGIASGFVAAAGGTLAYCALARAAFPGAAKTFISLLRRSSSPARTSHGVREPHR